MEHADLPPKAIASEADKSGREHVQKKVAWMLPDEGSHQWQRRQKIRVAMNNSAGKIIMGLFGLMVILLGVGLYQANPPSVLTLTPKTSGVLPPSSEVAVEATEETTPEGTVASIALERPKEEGLPQIGYEIISLDSNGKRLDLHEIRGKMEILVTGEMIYPNETIKTLCYNSSTTEKDIPVGVPQVIPLEAWWLREVDRDSIVLTVTIHREGDSDLKASMPVELDQSGWASLLRKLKELLHYGY